MNCNECQDWLQRRLDGEATPAAPEWEDHLAHCLTCRGQHQGFQLLLDTVQELKRPTPSPGLAGRIVASVLKDRRARRVRLRVRLATTVALAASLLLAALAGYLWLPKSKTALPDIVKKKLAPDPRLPVVVVEAPSLTRSVEEARAAVASLTEKIADKGKEQAWLWWPSAPEVLAPVKLERPLDPAAQSLRQTGQGVSESLQTVAQSAGRAVAYFFRELPPLDVAKSGS
jgi:predicted anti-sigma-YlaC factor YlaD